MKNEDFNCLQEFSFEDILYSNLAPILAYYSENYHTMLPDAVWVKAVKLKTMMAMEVESTDDIVLTVTRRTTQMKKDDRFLVLFTLLYMLYVPLPGQEDDTMLAIMAGIAREVYHHPWFEEAMLKMGVKRKEDDGCMAAEPLIGGNIDEGTMTDVAIALWDNCDDVTKRGLKLAFFEVNRASDNKFAEALDVMSALQNGKCTIEDLKRDRKKARMDIVVEDKGTTFKLKLTDKEVKKLLKEQCKVFGDSLTDERIEERKSFINDNVFESLGDHFTIEDLRRTKGENVSDTGLRMIISRWVKNEWVKKTGRKAWTKMEKV